MKNKEIIEKFKKEFPHGVYHLHISNGKITDDPKDNRLKGIVVPISDKIIKFIDQALIQVRAEQSENIQV